MQARRGRKSVQQRSTRGFHNLLQDELEIRARKNPQYSLRAFARDLGLAPSRLSEIIRRRRGLSVRTVARVSEKLGLPDHEIKFYTLRAQLAQAKDPKKKSKLKRELKELEAQFRFFEFPLEINMPLTWLHLGVLEAMGIPGFKLDPKWIASRFSVEEALVRTVLAELERLGLYWAEGGKPVRLARLIKFVPGPDIEAVEARREDLAQLLDRAKEAILEEKVGTFLSTTQYLALPESCLEDVRALIQEFKNKIASYYDSAEPGERVYCLNVNFIPLDDKT